MDGVRLSTRVVLGVVASVTLASAVMALHLPVLERNALVSFFEDTGGPNWNVNSGWNTTADPCTWYGVDCKEIEALCDFDQSKSCAHNSVSRLDLRLNNLAGTLPSEMADFKYIESVNFDNNLLTGALPVGLTGRLHCGWIQRDSEIYEYLNCQWQDPQQTTGTEPASP